MGISSGQGQADMARKLRVEYPGAVELKRAGWTEKELGKRPKGDKEKVGIGMRLRRETTMTVAWIAGRLEMGSRDAVNNLLCRKRKEKHNVRD
jgi:hypothetical protein